MKKNAQLPANAVTFALLTFVRSAKVTLFNLSNLLISRVCTGMCAKRTISYPYWLHVNQNFFSNASSVLRRVPRVLWILVGVTFLLGYTQAAAPDHAPFPAPASKKGLQVQMVEDALALGIKHAALNVNFAQMLTLTTNGDFSINERYLEQLDRQIKPLSDAEVVVSLILLYYRSGNAALDAMMLHPRYDLKAPNNLSAFNTSNEKSAAAYSACVEALAKRYSPANSTHGRVWNYIVGNEVNSHWFWANVGRVSMEEFADDYLRAVRSCHAAVRKHSANARVYISLEHHWNIRYPGGDEQQAFAGRP
ncbi:MAG: DUF5722 domain-containing protein, partial [Limisphaerales bacterium]